MRKLIFGAVSALVLIAAFFTTGCTSSSTDDFDNPVYNEYVAAYTSGNVSRRQSVFVVFSRDVRQSRIDSLKAEKLMLIEPSVEGKVAFADPHTLVFTPSKDMERDTRYSVNVDINSIFDAGEEFKFGFKTRPFAVNGVLTSFDVTSDDKYEFTFALNTVDVEEPATVESVVTTSVKGTTSWAHTGKSHSLKVLLSPDKAGTLEVSTVDNKELNLDGDVVVEAEIPSYDKLSVYSVKYKSGDTKYVEVTFNKNLDDRQKMRGLAFVENNTSETVDVRGNKLLLYPDNTDDGLKTVTLSAAIRSKDGMSLGSDVQFGVVMEEAEPSVRFVGDGTIIPQGDKVVIPFQSIYMKGVKVKVFKIFANMMGSMLQENDINAAGHLMYAGRPIAATTFYMDDYGFDLSEWHTYAIDLSDQVKLEPGAMYRVELSLDARLSAWKCDSLPTATREELDAEDKLMLAQIGEEFDGGGWYYTGLGYDQETGNYWWDDDYYEKRRNPSSTYFYKGRAVGKNVLATNIGLTALRGTDNIMKVVAINLLDSKPMSGVIVEAFSMQKQKVGQGATDSHGIAEIAYDEKLGQPLYLVATSGSDVSYLRVKRGEELSTSTFDVSGDVVQKGLKGYLYGDRGVWRPGDTLHISFMVNDAAKSLPENHPVSLQITNPLGQVYQKLTKTNGALGLYTFDVPVDADAPTGSWTAQATVGGVSFTKSLRIEAIKPNRLKIDLALPKVLESGRSSVKLHTEWLHGGVASGLKYDISATMVKTTTTFEGYKDYVFDNPTLTFDTDEQQVAKGEVNSTGDATVSINTQVDKSAPGMLRCNFVTHVYEPSGEFSTDVTPVYLSPYSSYVGIKSPLTSDMRFLDTEKSHKFSVVSVDQNAKPVAESQIEVKIYKVSWYWWWRADAQEMAGYTSSSYNHPVKTLHCSTGLNGKGSFELNFDDDDWGTYLIVAKDLNSGHSSGILSYFDWSWMTNRRSREGGESATTLSFTTDENQYEVGDNMKISFDASEGSHAIVAVCNGSKILSLDTYECDGDNTTIKIPVTEEMRPNVFVAVSLVQQYAHNNDRPIHMYGVMPVAVTSAKSYLNPQISCQDEIRPESKTTIKVSEKDGRPMAYTLAVVDEGLLDLTHFKTPNAWSTFNAREALGIRMWDLYGHVSGAYGGRIEQMFSIGGDEALNNAPKAIVNRFTPMVYFAGPFVLKKGQTRSHNINVPNYNGRVRVMVVAGDGEAYGNAEKSVLVRRPLMLIGTMPRQIGVGDEMTVSATVFASKKLGNVNVTIESSNNLEVIGSKSSSVTFNEAGDQTVHFRVKAGNQQGIGTVSLKASSSDDKVDYTTNIELRSVSQTVSKTTSVTVEAGKQWQDNLNVPGNGSYNIKIEASGVKPLNMANRLKSLIGYPHGCVEQTTSKVFPQLFLAEFAHLDENQRNRVEVNVKAGIDRLRSFQTSDGGMAYWSGGNYSNPWASAYVLFFFTEAEAKGYYVPEDMLKRLKGYVATKARDWKVNNYHSETFDACFSMFVLANAHAHELGAMNRMKEHADKLSGTELYMLSAAYSLAGRGEIATELLAKAVGGDKSYWYSPEVMKLIAQTVMGSTNIDATAESVRKRLMSDRWMSTSETSTSLVAMSKYYKKNETAKGLKMTASLDGKQIADVKSDKYSWNSEFNLSKNSAQVSVKNNNSGVMYLDVTAEGVATQGHIDSNSNGLQVSVSYTHADGSHLDPSSLSQGETVKAYVTIKNSSDKDLEHVAVTHILPAGWEVLSSEASDDVSYQDQRDDRMLSYIDSFRNGRSVTIVLNISATYSGKYYMPSVSAEAMYDATVSGCSESGMCEVK